MTTGVTRGMSGCTVGPSPGGAEALNLGAPGRTRGDNSYGPVTGGRSPSRTGPSKRELAPIAAGPSPGGGGGQYPNGGAIGPSSGGNAVTLAIAAAGGGSCVGPSPGTAEANPAVAPAGGEVEKAESMVDRWKRGATQNGVLTGQDSRELSGRSAAEPEAPQGFSLEAALEEQLNSEPADPNQGVNTEQDSR